MAIDETLLKTERENLQKDFNTLTENIKKVEKDLEQMKNNLNAVYGAIQQTDKLLKVVNVKGEASKMPDSKQKALNVATS